MNPKPFEDWDSSHEIAWGWLWENIEGLLSSMIGATLVTLPWLVPMQRFLCCCVKLAAMQASHDNRSMPWETSSDTWRNRRAVSTSIGAVVPSIFGMQLEPV